MDYKKLEEKILAGPQRRIEILKRLEKLGRKRMMGHWNHRVVRHRAGTELEYLAIHEAYYGIDGEDDVVWTKNPVSATGETVEELRETLERMLRALDKPVLEALTSEGDSNE